MITLEEIKKTAKLAKIEITEEEAQLYTKQLDTVLEWVAKLQEIKTVPAKQEDIPCTYQRQDTPVSFENSAALSAAFNDKKDNFLKVKKVL
jgi:aspartyl-tRNA(Asn)/glutamyl-tRNA(Gln) amidotransferase subunit C